MVAENQKLWRIAVFGARDECTEFLRPALEHMNGCLAKARAGATQTQLASRWPVWMTELGAQGQQIIDTYDLKLTRVSEGQAGAGGAQQVYGEKRAASR